MCNYEENDFCEYLHDTTNTTSFERNITNGKRKLSKSEDSSREPADKRPAET